MKKETTTTQTKSTAFRSNLWQLFRLHLRQSYAYRSLCGSMIGLLIFIFIHDLLKVFLWRPEKNIPEYSVFLGRLTPIFLILTVSYVIYRSTGALCDKSIGMYPGNSVSRLLSRILADGLVLAFIPLLICLVSIVRHGILWLGNRLGLLDIILYFSWSNLVCELIHYIFLFWSMYSVLLFLWILLSRSHPVIRVLTIITCILLGNSFYETSPLSWFWDTLLNLYFYPEVTPGAILPPASFLQISLFLILFFLDISLLLAKHRFTVWKESRNWHYLQTASLAIVVILLVTVAFLPSSIDSILSQEGGSFISYANSMAGKSFTLQAPAEELEQAFQPGHQETIPTVSRRGRHIDLASESSAETRKRDSFTAAELGISFAYSSPSNPFPFASYFSQEEIRKPDQAPGEFSTEDDTLVIQAYGEEIMLHGEPLFQKYLDQMEFSIEKETLQIKLPTSPLVVNCPFGVTYNLDEDLASYLLGEESNPLYHMFFVVSGTDHTIEALQGKSQK